MFLCQTDEPNVCVMPQVFTEHVDQVVVDENFEQTILTFDTNFSKHFLELLDKIMDENNTKPHNDHNLFSIIYRSLRENQKPTSAKHQAGASFMT